MSIKESSRVWETSKQDSTALLLLLALADCANDWGHCFPGRQFLAKYARCDIATVSRLIAKLEQDGELYAIRQKGRGTHYVILCGLPAEETQIRQRKLHKFYGGSDQTQLPSSDHRVTTSSDLSTTTGSDLTKGKTVRDPSIEPSKEPPVTPQPPADTPSVENIYTLYEHVLGMMINSSREAELLADIESAYPLDWIKDAMEESVRNNVRKIAYFEAILKRWKAEGRTLKAPTATTPAAESIVPTMHRPPPPAPIVLTPEQEAANLAFIEQETKRREQQRKSK